MPGTVRRFNVMDREFYINNLEINHLFIRNCFDNFIDSHGELYGRVISEYMLLSNVDFIFHLVIK